MNTIKSLIVATLLTAPLLSAAPMPEKADLLASNTVIAQYIGTTERPCMFRTALCPDRCDHAATIAEFRVLKNVDYQRVGKYGDDKAEVGSVVMVDLRHEEPGQDPSVNQTIRSLKPGDTVQLTQDHYYGQVGCAMTPFRPIRKIEKVERPADAPELPALEEQHPVMPISRRGR